MSGLTSYHAGLSAEAQVAQDYEQRGYQVLRQRWRGKAGEIDLVIDGDPEIIFVEVKKSKSHARAAHNVTPKQQMRLFSAAEEFLATHPGGQSRFSRFDVALLDQHGQLQIIENALGF